MYVYVYICIRYTYISVPTFVCSLFLFQCFVRKVNRSTQLFCCSRCRRSLSGPLLSIRLFGLYVGGVVKVERRVVVVRNLISFLSSVHSSYPSLNEVHQREFFFFFVYLGNRILIYLCQVVRFVLIKNFLQNYKVSLKDE